MKSVSECYNGLMKQYQLKWSVAATLDERRHHQVGELVVGSCEQREESRQHRSPGLLAADGRPGQHVATEISTTTGVGHEASRADVRQVGLDTMFKSERILYDKGGRLQVPIETTAFEHASGRLCNSHATTKQEGPS